MTAPTSQNFKSALDTRMSNAFSEPCRNLVSLVKSRPQSSSIKADTNRLPHNSLSGTTNANQMSAPCLASSNRRNIIRVKIKKSEEAGAVIRSTKEELYNNSSSDMKPPESTCCSSSQVARVAQPESPSRILELMTTDELSDRPRHSPPKSRISNLVPLSSQMGKLPSTKRPSEGILPDPSRNQVSPVKSRPQSSSIKANTNRLPHNSLSGTTNANKMSAPRLASSDRKNIIRIRIKKSEKEAGAVIRSTKEELYNNLGQDLSANLSLDMKPPENTCCSSSQVARKAQAESPGKILELMTAYPLSGKPIHSPLKSRISDLVPLSNQMAKPPPTKRPSEGILDLDRGQKRRKLEDSLREKGMVPDGNRTVKQETISHSMSASSRSHQILTSTGSSCVIEGQKKGKIGDSTAVPEVNKSKEASLLLNEARDFKHRADRLKREGEKVLSEILYLEAILKFLQVASLWEQGPGENNEAAVRLYSDTAKLCHYCAAECQMEQNMPAAALAYKAMELAYMRSAFVKSTFPKEAVSMGDDMTSAFEATKRYQTLMHSEKLAAPVIACINFHFNDVAVFIHMARQAM